MTQHNRTLGRWGEDRAAAHVEEHGYQIVARNYRTPFGELDLIIEKADVLVFVEVKTRSSLTFGQPEAAVTLKKQAHLVDAAQYFLQEKQWEERPWRIDVISILRSPSTRETEITWFENALV